MQIFEAFLPETDSKPQISVMVNVQFCRICVWNQLLIGLTIFDVFFIKNYDSIIVNFKLVEITDFLAAL